MQLLVLRHAKSSWADRSTDDWERPLTERGTRDAAQVGEWLRRRSLIPNLIISSDAVRAQTTAQLASDAAGYAGRIVLSPALYHATPAAVIEVVQGAPHTAALVMIVGHNPGLEDLTSQLSGEEIGFSTSTLVHLDLPIDQWSDLEVTTPARVLEQWNPGDG